MKEKIIEWLDVDSSPQLVKDSLFVESDRNVNVIVVKVNEEYNGKDLQLLITQNSSSDVPKYYTSIITNGVAKFMLDETELLRGVYKVYIRIIEAGKTLAACVAKYQIECGRIFGDVIPPVVLGDTATKLIEELKNQIALGEAKDAELKATIVDADGTKTRLEGTIRIADTAKTNLQHVIDISIVAGNTLDNKTAIANTTCQNLDNKVIEANKVKSDLVAEINKVPGKVLELQNEGNTQISNVGGEGVKQVEVVGVKGTEQVNLVAQQGELEVARVNTQGVAEIDKVTAEGDKKIAEIQAFPATKNLNINDNQEYSTWLGTESKFDSITNKQRGVYYMGFNDLFSLTRTWFRPRPRIVKDSMVFWLDAIDGENGNDTWRDRSGNGNDATLLNFSWTAKSGFNGKSLVLDGVDDKYVLKNPALTNYTLFIKGKINDNSVRNRVVGKEFITGKNQITLTYNSSALLLVEPNVTSHDTKIATPTEFELVVAVTNSKSVKVIMNELTNSFSFVARDNFNTWENMYNDETTTRINIHSIKLYSRVLSDEEIEQNLDYEQSIDRVVPTTYPLVEETKDYCIGNATDLTEEQKKTFRLSVDKTKFVSGINNIKGTTIETYTYSEIQKLMETPEWRSESDIMQ